jgi:hypothetical protein
MWVDNFGSSDPLDQVTAGVWVESTSVQPGSLTPSVPNCTVVQALWKAAGTAVTISPGAHAPTEDITNTDFGHLYGALDYAIQTSAAASNPTWTLTSGTEHLVAQQAIFKPAAAAGSPFAGHTEANPTLARVTAGRGSVDASDFNLLKDTQFRGPGQFTGYDWPNPQRPRRSLDLLTGTSNDLTIRLPSGAIAAPFAQSSWPNPRGSAPPRVGWELWYAVDDAAPFAQTQWPNPVRAIVRRADWVTSVAEPLLPALQPFALHDWPNPVLRKTWHGGLWWQNLLNTLQYVAPAPMPFNQYAWPVPPGARRGISLRGFAQPSAFHMLVGERPFTGLAFVVPRGAQFPIDLRGLAHNALTTAPVPPVILFRPQWAVNSNRDIGFEP